MSGEGRADPLIERYVAGGPVLAYAVSGLTPEHEKARPGPGDWSIAQLVAHLLDSDLVFSDRIKRVLAEDEPLLQAFDENAWAERLGYESTTVEEAVNLLAANRHWTAAILRRASEADFARAGQHSARGRQTLAEVLSTCVNHLDHHLRFLYAKRANLGVALPPRYTAQ